MMKSSVADIEKMKVSLEKRGCLDEREARELIQAYEIGQAMILDLRMKVARLELKTGARPKLTLVKAGKPSEPKVKLDQPKRETRNASDNDYAD